MGDALSDWSGYGAGRRTGGDGGGWASQVPGKRVNGISLILMGTIAYCIDLSGSG